MDASVAATLSDSASPSGGESDADAHPRVHPSAVAPPPPPPAALHGFACAFTRGRCGHDELFRPHYTRTNLRKGDKILRCFPHCCPDHVTRSFCGASLHLDVTWRPEAGNSSSSSPEVLVFARFRVQDARGRGPGDHVTLAEIAQSLQSESNPHGEWIAAASVSASSSSSAGDAASAREWVFELNHEARWYYHWESGVAKRHRLKHHVLDVFVLSPSFGAGAAAATDPTDDRRALQVVAVARSPPFRLISFRRATPKAVQALSVPRVQRVSRSSGATASSDARTAPTITTSAISDRNARASPTTTTPHAARRPREARSREEEEKTSQVVPEARVRPVHGPPPTTTTTGPQRVGQYHQPRPHPYHPGLPYPRHQFQYQQQGHFPQLQPHHAHSTRPVSGSTGGGALPPPAAVGRPSFADLTSFLQRQPRPTMGASAPQPPSQPQPQPHARPQPQSQPTPLSTRRTAAAAASQRLLLLLRCLHRVRTVDTVAYMDTFQRVYADALARAGGIPPHHQQATAPSQAPANAVYQLLADAGVLHATRPGITTLPARVTAILCELLLWLSFDVDLHRAVHAIVARDAAAVVSQPRLHEAFVGLVEWLERHVDAFLHDRGWRLEEIVHETDAAARGTEPIGPLHQDEAFAVALRVCVAQFSEHCASQSQASASARRGHRRRRYEERGPASLRTPLGRWPSQWTINGDWKCEMLLGDLSVRSLGSAPDEFSLVTLFALLRELGAISLRIGRDPEAMKTALDVASLLNPAGASSGTRLVLDEPSRWFRTFPSGLSTAALAPGGLQWGDYEGETARASEAVRCRLYAWTRSSPSTAAALGHCVELELWTPTADSLVARVACSRALPDVAAVAPPQPLALLSLAQKLRLVRAWEPTREAELRYTRVHVQTHTGP